MFWLISSVVAYILGWIVVIDEHTGRILPGWMQALALFGLYYVILVILVSVFRLVCMLLL